MAGHVFISHASENRDEANELVALIEAKGITAWIAPRDVRPGLDYSEELQRAIESCAAFVVLVTDMANKSPYVRAETEMAFSCHKPMLPVRISAIQPAAGLAFFLKIRHWTDAYGPTRDASLARLVLELQTLTGGAPSWAPGGAAAAPPPFSDDGLPPAPPVTPPAPPSVSPAAGSNARLVPWAIGGGIALVALVVAIVLLTRPATVMPPVPAPDNGSAPAPPRQARAYAGEMVDFGVPPKAELESNVGTPTPLSVPGGQRLTTEEVQRMIAENPRAILVDVLAGNHAQTLAGALYMPAGGMPGTFDDNYQSQFTQQLSQAVAGDAARPLIFFCQGASCWESYNAALRARAAGATSIYWYRGGLAAWQEAGLPMVSLPAPYGGSADAY